MPLGARLCAIVVCQLVCLARAAAWLADWPIIANTNERAGGDLHKSRSLLTRHSSDSPDAAAPRVASGCRRRRSNCSFLAARRRLHVELQEVGQLKRRATTMKMLPAVLRSAASGRKCCCCGRQQLSSLGRINFKPGAHCSWPAAAARSTNRMDARAGASRRVSRWLSPTQTQTAGRRRVIMAPLGSARLWVTQSGSFCKWTACAQVRGQKGGQSERARRPAVGPFLGRPARNLDRDSRRR